MQPAAKNLNKHTLCYQFNYIDNYHSHYNPVLVN